jgi:cob(I)alamin adenosyltransferase
MKETMKETNKGYIHVYTGNGKGKTTASLGLALRAAGWEKKIFIAQFMKKTKYGELISIGKLLKEYITIKQYGIPEFHHRGSGINQQEIDTAMEGIQAVKDAFASGRYDIIILDEINILAHFKIIELKILLDLIDSKPEGLELIMTGRNAPEEFLQRAHLVTEMKEIKHYYKQGIQARIGVER